MNYTYISLKALHLLGAILWFGGIITVAFTALAFAREAKADAMGTLRGASRLPTTLGVFANWIGGLSIFIINIDTFRTQGWLHAKLLLVFIGAGLTGVLTAELKKVAEGKREPNPKKLRIFAIALTIIPIVTVALAGFRPF